MPNNPSQQSTLASFLATTAIVWRLREVKIVRRWEVDPDDELTQALDQ